MISEESRLGVFIGNVSSIVVCSQRRLVNLEYKWRKLKSMIPWTCDFVYHFHSPSFRWNHKVAKQYMLALFIYYLTKSKVATSNLFAEVVDNWTEICRSIHLWYDFDQRLTSVWMCESRKYAKTYFEPYIWYVSLITIWISCRSSRMSK